MEQQSVANKTILDFCNKPEDTENVQEARSSCTVKVEEVFEGAPSNAFLENSVNRISDLRTNACQDADVAHCRIVKQEQVSSHKSVAVPGVLQLLGQDQEERPSRAGSRATSPRTRTDVKKHETEDVIVEVVEPSFVDDVRLDLVDQARECSSSFSSTQNCLGTDEVGDDSYEAESQFRDGNCAIAPTEDLAQPLRKKRALTAEWKAYRWGIEWQCRWLELQVKELQAQSSKYDKILTTARSYKQQLLEQQDGLAARTNPLVNITRKIHVLQRQPRRKAQEDVDVKSYMSRHPLFSRYEKKKRRDHEEVSAEEVMYEEGNHRMLELEDLNRLEDREIEEELGDEFASEEDSMEQLLWHIETLQMHVMKLKSQLARGDPVGRNSTKVQCRDAAVFSSRGSGHPFLFSASRSMCGPAIHCLSQTGARPMLSGSEIPASSSIAQNQLTNHDIDNMIIPSNVMAESVEPTRDELIDTPHWRCLDNDAVPAGESSSDEDTDDELCRRHHAEMEVREQERQYTFSTKTLHVFGKGGSKSGSKGVSKASGNGVGEIMDGFLVEDDLDLTIDFGFVPKGKRRKRESRDVALTPKMV